MPTEEIPALEPDHHVEQVPAEPVGPAECGSWVFTRDLAGHLADLLKLPVAAMTIRSHPYDPRSRPKLTIYELRVGPHRITVTWYETTRPLTHGPVDSYAVVIDEQPIDFERPNHREPLQWQLARSIWIAVTDRQLAAARTATTT